MNFIQIGKNMDYQLLMNLVTPLVGLVAIYVYKVSKKDEKKSASAIITMDIRHAEQVVLSIKERNVIDRHVKAILQENNWEKYKHLFVNDISSDDFVSFNRFFDSCVEIADARKRMKDVFYTSVNAKATLMQQKIFDISNLDTPEGQKEREKIMHFINVETSDFNPLDPVYIVRQNIDLMGNLTNTIAFQKLKKLAGL
jgi:hypothetical protein